MLRITIISSKLDGRVNDTHRLRVECIDEVDALGLIGNPIRAQPHSPSGSASPRCIQPYWHFRCKLLATDCDYKVAGTRVGSR